MGGTSPAAWCARAVGSVLAYVEACAPPHRDKEPALTTSIPAGTKHQADSDAPVSEAEAAWQSALARTPDREGLYTTMSGDPIPRMSTPESAAIDYERDLGYPAQHPYTRGVYPSMYRGKPWTQ